MASAADRRRLRAIVAATILACGFGFVACGRSNDSHVRVFAAASMADSMQRLAADFERLHPDLAVRLHCAGTPHLLMQLREGAVADVFVAADEQSMADLGRFMRPGSAPMVFATNELTIVVAAGNPEKIATLADLERPGLLVAMCAPDVPAGRYAREACRRAGVDVRSVSDEPDVGALLTKVRLGELDAGILYVTDVVATATGAERVAIPAAHNVRATYPVAALGSRRQARLFADYLLTEGAREILRSSGFGVP